LLEREVFMDYCIAEVLCLNLVDPVNSYATAKSSRTDMSIVRFSLNADVWNEVIFPSIGDTVLLSKIRKHGDRWIAKEASLWKDISKT
jgi:hypothetical protein